MGGAPDEPETHTQIGASPTTPAIPPPPIVPRPTPGLVVQTDGRSIVIQWSPDPIPSTAPAGPTSDAQAPRTTVSHPTPPDRATRAPERERSAPRLIDRLSSPLPRRPTTRVGVVLLPRIAPRTTPGNVADLEDEVFSGNAYNVGGIRHTLERFTPLSRADFTTLQQYRQTRVFTTKYWLPYRVTPAYASESDKRPDRGGIDIVRVRITVETCSGHYTIAGREVLVFAIRGLPLSPNNTL